MISAAALAAVLATASLAADAQPTSAPTFAACDVASYYANLPAAPLDAARADMHQLLEDTHRDQLPYTSSSYGDVWDALIDVDGDASGENVRLVYKDAWVPATPYDSGTCEYWNREHIWSRSRGVGSSGMDNTDLHHLRPSDCNVNSARSNLYFGACGTARPSSECTSPAHPEAANDTAKDAATFLPPANRKGDIARAILYMDLRYDGGETSTTLDLVVSDCPEAVPDGAGMGYLSQLLQWHLDDPPDEEERQRNDKVCADWQGNRNPFVDYPELALKYHGGARPLLGEGLGYDCEATPAAGTCSDGSGQCLSTNHCSCSSSLFSRKLTGLRGKLPSTRKLETSKLLVTGVFDGPLSGGLPKMVELYATDDISDLSSYGVGSANNGGGTDGEEFELSGSAAARSFITVSKEAARFTEYFGEAPTFLSGTMSVNGDDAIELFFNGAVVDVFGDANTDGTGQAWEYMDGFAYRVSGSSPGSAFQIDDWAVSGKNAVDGCSSNDSCGVSFPAKTFQAATTPSPTGPVTQSPTSSPSSGPTASPSAGLTSPPPTQNPTSSPSKSPSIPSSCECLGVPNELSASPTASPSAPPTMPQLPSTDSPTRSPSKVPTNTPTRFPSKTPTASPVKPTDNPTEPPCIPGDGGQNAPCCFAGPNDECDSGVCEQKKNGALKCTRPPRK